MKASNVLVFVLVLSLMVGGAAMAWGGPNRSEDCVADRAQMKQNMSIMANAERKPNVDYISELTGKTAEELKELCTKLKEEGKTLADYLKEEGLYDEFKANIISKFEDRINSALENGKIDAEKAETLLNTVKEKINNGQLANGTRTGMKLNISRGCGKGRMRRNK